MSQEPPSLHTYEQSSDLPAPGIARRRVLRELGIRITRDDFNAEELEKRRPLRGPGWYRDLSSPGGHHFWDGDQWTRDAPVPGDEPPSPT